MTQQHFTHDRHIAHTSTALFSTPVVVSVLPVLECFVFASRLLDTQCCTDRMLIRGSRKRALSQVSPNTKHVDNKR